MQVKPEDKARLEIDRQLIAAGWAVQDIKDFDPTASTGIAVREFPLQRGSADYLLIVDRKAIGVVEAKPAGDTLGGVDWQSDKYINNLPDTLQRYGDPLPFAYESTGVETLFRCSRDPEPKSRRVFGFHRPETLKEWAEQEKTLRARLRDMPPLDERGLRRCQGPAIRNLEHSLASDRPRALIQMATGSGKTFTAISFINRLITYGKAKRILFLVDRGNLGKQTMMEFQQYVCPDNGKKFLENYNIQHLKKNVMDKNVKVCISTVQRLYSILSGQPEMDEELEEHSQYELDDNGNPVEVTYNPYLPIEYFDFIVVDECHRSIYGKWRQVLEYFDAFLIGLTATPHKQTFGFFKQNLVMEYNFDRAVADGVNVGYDVYRIQTEITSGGGKVETGFYVDKRDKETRKVRWERLEEDLHYTAQQLDKDVVAEDQIRLVIRTFRDKLSTEIFPGRTEVPKTLIFAKDDSHADDILQIVRDEFGKGNDFAKKITYKASGEKPEDLITAFRNSYNPRIAITVDMISTGTDIKPLECLLFMRSIKSANYFEQMKGRGARSASETEMMQVNSDPLARKKTHFVIVDAVGVCARDKTDSRPLERKRNVSFEKLLLQIAMGNRDKDNLTSLAGRLAKIEREMEPKDRERLSETAGGVTINEMINRLMDATDPDKQADEAKTLFGVTEPTEEQIQQATQTLIETACAPFDSPKVRQVLEDIRRQNEQTIDTVSQDVLLFAGYDEQAADRAKGQVESFRQFIEENKDEITALQILYAQPYNRRLLTYKQIKELAEAMKRPPYLLNTDELWLAYEKLDKSRVQGRGPQVLLTDIISLVRFATGQAQVLEHYPDLVNQRYADWLARQEQSGNAFTPEQLEWLSMIKEHIATSLSITPDDFDSPPFYDKGGLYKVFQLFGQGFNKILDELNEVLAA
jgi:type I restriction enzyme R subunit